MKIFRKIFSLSLTAIFAGIVSITSFSCATTKLFETDADYYQSVINSFNSPAYNYISSKEKSENVNKISVENKFPKKVYVKTLTQTFMKGWQFVISDGRIYAKKDGEPEWKLFTKDGKPKKAESICEIYGDGDCLFAFDNAGKLYKLYTEKTTVDKTFKWVENFGWPQKTQLVQNALVAENRGWAMGTRRRDVLWYEDIFGNEHHYGTMGLETIYFLAKDGQRILFTDSGLPNDFSKSIENPEHGRFIARSISNSASTLFLIGDDGTMYTRLIDFDTMGCDPMFFKYTYKKEPQKYSGAEYLSNYAPWGLPAEPWKKEPPIKLEGKARLSRFISIHQNGQGNSARELRVAGTNKDGVKGYYYKQIANEIWNFKPAPLNFAESDFLTGDAKRGNSTDLSFEGYLTQNGNRNDSIEISTDDFSLTSEGEFHLKFKMKKDGWNEEKTLKLHNVAQWTYATRIEPGYDGTAMYYFVTPDFDETLFETEHEEFNSLLKSIFDGSDKKNFVFTAAATTNYLELYGNGQTGKKVQFKIFLAKKEKAAGAEYKDFVSPDTYKAFTTFLQYSSDSYNDENLIVAPKEAYSQENLSEINEKIENNANYRRFINGELKTYKKYMKKSNLSRWSYNFVDLITTVTLLNQIDFPKIKTMTSFGGRLLKSNAENFKSFYEYRSLTAPHIIQLVDLRLKEYENLAKSVENNGVAVLPARLKNSYTEYFDEVFIPAAIQGETPKISKISSLSRLDTLPMYPGFYLAIGENKNEQSVVVVAKKAADEIFKRGKKNNSFENLKKKPLKIKVNFIAEKGKSKYLGSIADISFIEKKSGQLTWDGETMKITVGHFLLKKTLFEGKSDFHQNKYQN